jgi:hypothetical protein
VTPSAQSDSKAAEIIWIDAGSSKKMPSSRASVVEAVEKLTDPMKARCPSAIIIFACS